MRFNWMTVPWIRAATFSVICFISIGSFIGFPWVGIAARLDDQLEKEPLHITVILERSYLDGEVSQEVVKETCWSMEDFWAKYEEWRLVSRDKTKMVFRKQVDDISPLLKANGFFGITKDGVLTIFNGRPDHSRIIQSFFQIDMKRLESKKQEELMQGIPILTKDRYVQVLETFKPYSIKKE